MSVSALRTLKTVVSSISFASNEPATIGYRPFSFFFLLFFFSLVKHSTFFFDMGCRLGFNLWADLISAIVTIGCFRELSVCFVRTASLLILALAHTHTVFLALHLADTPHSACHVSPCWPGLRHECTTRLFACSCLCAVMWIAYVLILSLSLSTS